MTVSVPQSAKPGPEMAALAPFYRNWAWTGTIEAGGMGPGSPEMTGRGKTTSRAIQGGLWYACDFEQDQFLMDGTFVLKWQLHWVTGWDRATGEYRASCADNNGPTLDIYRGALDGDRLIYEPVHDRLPRLRFTHVLTGPERSLWRNEISVDGEDWSLIEEYQMEAVD
jgi:hypothetical protein